MKNHSSSYFQVLMEISSSLMYSISCQVLGGIYQQYISQFKKFLSCDLLLHILLMYRMNHFIVTEGGKIHLKETFLKWLSNSETAHSRKKLLLTWKRKSHWGYLTVWGSWKDFTTVSQSATEFKGKWLTHTSLTKKKKKNLGHNKICSKKYWVRCFFKKEFLHENLTSSFCLRKWYYFILISEQRDEIKLYIQSQNTTQIGSIEF